MRTHSNGEHRSREFVMCLAGDIAGDLLAKRARGDTCQEVTGNEIMFVGDRNRIVGMYKPSTVISFKLFL